MRRLLAIGVLAALALPAATQARVGDPNDGTFSLRDGRGTFTVLAKGGVIGSFVRGRVIITDPIAGDGTGPIVSGDDWRRDKTETTTVYGGTRVRFRMIGGTFRVRVVDGVGVNLSVVGRGRVTLEGAGTVDDGSYSVNGDPYGPVPLFLQFTLTATSP